MDRTARRYANGITAVLCLATGILLVGLHSEEFASTAVFGVGIGMALYVGVYAYQSGILAETVSSNTSSAS